MRHGSRNGRPSSKPSSFFRAHPVRVRSFFWEKGGVIGYSIPVRFRSRFWQGEKITWWCALLSTSLFGLLMACISVRGVPAIICLSDVGRHDRESVDRGNRGGFRWLEQVSYLDSPRGAVRIILSIRTLIPARVRSCCRGRTSGARASEFGNLIPALARSPRTCVDVGWPTASGGAPTRSRSRLRCSRSSAGWGRSAPKHPRTPAAFVAHCRI